MTFSRLVKNVVLSCLWIPVLSLSGCATEWTDSGSFYRPIETKVCVDSPPQGKVYVNNKYIGDSPISTSLDYNQKVDKRTRKVSYWTTQPGWSLLLSIASLGIYVPFSFIPVDIETSLEPAEVYKDNEFTVRVTTPAGLELQETILCTGQESILFAPSPSGEK